MHIYAEIIIRRKQSRAQLISPYLQNNAIGNQWGKGAITLLQKERPQIYRQLPTDCTFNYDVRNMGHCHR